MAAKKKTTKAVGPKRYTNVDALYAAVRAECELEFEREWGFAWGSVPGRPVDGRHDASEDDDETTRVLECEARTLKFMRRAFALYREGNELLKEVAALDLEKNFRWIEHEHPALIWLARWMMDAREAALSKDLVALLKDEKKRKREMAEWHAKSWLPGRLGTVAFLHTVVRPPKTPVTPKHYAMLLLLLGERPFAPEALKSKVRDKGGATVKEVREAARRRAELTLKRQERARNKSISGAVANA